MKIRWLVLLALISGRISGLTPAVFAKEHPPLPPGSVEWLRPLAGAVLIGGAPARLEWHPGPRFDQLVAVDEWELFLSADGGRTWPIRLTPHLSSQRRSILIEVPNLAVLDGRLMLRMGNEESEYEAVLPGHVEIRLAGERREILPPTAVANSVASAAANEEGVALWAAGDRGGGGIRWVARAPAPHRELAGDPASMRAQRGDLPFLPEPRSEVAPHKLATTRPRGSASSHPARSHHLPIGFGPSPRLATCRSNR